MIIQLNDRGQLVNKYNSITEIKHILPYTEEEIRNNINTGHSFGHYWWYSFFIDNNDWKNRNE